MSSETAMTPCRLPECSVPMEEGEWQLSSRHHLCQHSKQTHTWLQGNQAHIQPVRYLTLSAAISCREKMKAQVSEQRLLLLYKVEKDGWGFCVLWSRD